MYRPHCRTESENAIVVCRLDCLAVGRADVNVPCGASMLPSLRIRGLCRGTEDAELVGLCGPEVIWVSAAWDTGDESIGFCL